MKRFGSRGEGRLGCILWLAVLGAGILIAVKAVPVKITDVEFKDYLEQQAQAPGRTPGEELHKRILGKAKELGIKLDPKKLKVQKSARRVIIECTYTVTLDFGVYSYDWVFDHKIDRPVFIV